jgi:hypothetical protein
MAGDRRKAAIRDIGVDEVPATKLSFDPLCDAHKESCVGTGFDRLLPSRTYLQEEFGGHISVGLLGDRRITNKDFQE